MNSTVISILKTMTVHIKILSKAIIQYKTTIINFRFSHNKGHEEVISMNLLKKMS